MSMHRCKGLPHTCAQQAGCSAPDPTHVPACNIPAALPLPPAPHFCTQQTISS